MPRHRLATLCLAMPCSLAACQPLPHPFAEQHLAPGAPIITLNDAVGIDVLPVKGVPPATAATLAKGMIDGLQAAEIPASMQLLNANSYRLAVNADGINADATGVTGTLVWTLSTAQGKFIGEDKQAVSMDGASWRGGQVAVHDLGQAESAAIAAFVQAPPTVAHNAAPGVYLRPITGAPGDGDEALARSMAYLLRRQGIQIVDHPVENAISIGCAVHVTPAPDQVRRVDIIWQVVGIDDKEIGQIKQSNTVPAGTLDGHWQGIAIDIASAASGSVIGLVKNAGGS